MATQTAEQKTVEERRPVAPTNFDSEDVSEPDSCPLHSRCRYSDLQDVCMAIESLTTLDLPMIIDSIGIYELKGPYCTLTMTDWFLQALSVIPRGSWGDVSRRFTLIRWVSPKIWFRSRKCCEPTASYRSDLIVDRDYDEATVMDFKPMFTLGLARSKPIKLVQAHGKSINRGHGPSPTPPSSSKISFRPLRRGDSVREIFVEFSSADPRRNWDSDRGPD
ncbi:hypothetical protein F511_31008 [Dorcoceras hygrometricum]|uniref:Uncharacterized protein n=1 Tax=Dorcoceras hygrometricum TaxID=472368 RepID=A0A2Z7BBI9_9LAMI|nr:hypothetical protein F511_31008 [Dorcoceras hygrometricum]